MKKRGFNRKKWFISLVIILFIVVFVLAVLEIRNDIINLSPAEKVRLTAEEKAKIADAKKKVSESNGHDYSKLYEVLKEKKGNKGRLFAICDDFGEPIFCLKKVSAENSNFREETCRKLEVEIRKTYGEMMTEEKLERFVNGHKEDCMLGIPQFSY